MMLETELDTSPLTDEQLATAAAREDSDGPAFTALVARYQQRVWRICFRLLGNEHDASDAAQEVFVRLFLHRARFAGRSKYSTWVHGVAVRTCLTLRRGRSRRQRREDMARERSVQERARKEERQQAPAETLDLPQMLDTLEEDDRALLILKYAEGHGYDELAEMFELSVSACKMRILRARERLKQRFPEHEF
jgi:RNA polymerase sigma-70 factor (ECF subfamily)